jgi:hypothetical protein
MNQRLAFLLIISAFLLMGCNKYIAPPFTSVDKISKLKPGMKLRQVVDILGIEPYNIYHMQKSGSQLFTFNYRLKNRKLKVETLNRDEFSRKTTNEESQTSGVDYYDKHYKTLYVLIDNGELTSFTTTQGADDSEFLMIHQNNLNVISEKYISQYDSLRDTIPNVEIYRILQNNKSLLPGRDGRSKEESFLKRIF